MQEFRLRLSGLVLSSSLFCGPSWIAIHALWKLQAAGQGAWGVVWSGLLFAVGMGVPYIHQQEMRCPLIPWL
jgi:hypothetical protein